MTSLVSSDIGVLGDTTLNIRLMVCSPVEDKQPLQMLEDNDEEGHSFTLRSPSTFSPAAWSSTSRCFAAGSSQELLQFAEKSTSRIRGCVLPTRPFFGRIQTAWVIYGLKRRASGISWYVSFDHFIVLTTIIRTAKRASKNKIS